jgi:hypothetical protein
VAAVKGAAKRSGKKGGLGRSSSLKPQWRQQDVAAEKAAGVRPLLRPLPIRDPDPGMARQAQAAVCLEGEKLV